jgi:hypothetical protein
MPGEARTPTAATPHPITYNEKTYSEKEYPSRDGKPVAETPLHRDVLLGTVARIRRELEELRRRLAND